MRADHPEPSPARRRLRRTGLVLCAVCLGLTTSGAAAVAEPPPEPAPPAGPGAWAPAPLNNIVDPAVLETAPLEASPSSARIQTVSRARAKTGAAADAIALDVERNGSLAVTLTWAGGAGPYDVLIDPSTGDGSYESGVDDTTLTVAAEPDRSYCFEVYGSDGSASDRECLSAPRL